MGAPKVGDEVWVRGVLREVYVMPAGLDEYTVLFDGPNGANTMVVRKRDVRSEREVLKG